MPPISPEARARFDALVEELSAERDAVRAVMFGMPSAKIAGGKTFMGLYGDDLAVKVGTSPASPTLAIPGADMFNPSGKKPMREWLMVPASAAEHWAAAAREAEEFVRSAV